MGSIAGLVATLVMSAVFGHIEWTYGVMAVVILASLAPTVWAARGEGMARPSPREHEPLRVAVAGFLRPLASGDFAWVIYTRTLITAGIYCILPYLQLFFRDVVHVANAANFVATSELLLLLAATPLGLAGGWASDRIGRKVFVYAAGAVMTLVVVLFVILYPTAQLDRPHAPSHPCQAVKVETRRRHTGTASTADLPSLARLVCCAPSGTSPLKEGQPCAVCKGRRQRTLPPSLSWPDLSRGRFFP